MITPLIFMGKYQDVVADEHPVLQFKTVIQTEYIYYNQHGMYNHLITIQITFVH
jgi:hypothetical protein